MTYVQLDHAAIVAILMSLCSFILGFGIARNCKSCERRKRIQAQAEHPEVWPHRKGIHD